MLYTQLTPDVVLQHLGKDPETVQLRRAFGLHAREVLRSQFRCEALPDFVGSVDRLLQTAFPPWYRRLFVNPALTAL